MQGPEPYLIEQHLTVTDPVEPARTAVLDAAHRSFVNYEIFFFTDDTTKRRFDDDPIRWCGVLTDPVSRQRFVPGSESPRRYRAGRTFFFPTAASAETFDAMPDMYAIADYSMLPAPQATSPTSPDPGPAAGRE